MGVGVVVPMRMPVVMGRITRMAVNVVVVMVGLGRGGNHGLDVIL